MLRSGCARGNFINSRYFWIWPSLATATYIALMTALARASGISYLLFPELGALASVVFADPLSSWARSPKLLALTPVFTAVPGVLLTRTLPYGARRLFPQFQPGYCPWCWELRVFYTRWRFWWAQVGWP